MKDAYAKLQAFGDGREELATDVRGTSWHIIKLVKLVNRARNVGKEGKMVASLLLTLPVKGKPREGRRGEVTASELPWTLVIEADDYVASLSDKTIETRYEQGVMVSMVDAEEKN